MVKKISSILNTEDTKDLTKRMNLPEERATQLANLVNEAQIKHMKEFMDHKTMVSNLSEEKLKRLDCLLSNPFNFLSVLLGGLEYKTDEELIFIAISAFDAWFFFKNHIPECMTELIARRAEIKMESDYILQQVAMNTNKMGVVN